MRSSIPRRWPDLSREKRLWRQGYLRAAGLDEAGRGAWAGPLAAAAVILPVNQSRLKFELCGVRDSKQMTPGQRETAAEQIRSLAIAWAVGSATAGEVDSLGPLRATRLAMLRAIEGLRVEPDHLLVDYLRLSECPLPQLAVVHGDALSLSIAAASVIAKTWRDGQMVALGKMYPAYGFDRHKGYGTREHVKALRDHGICPEHRKSYAPIQLLNG